MLDLQFRRENLEEVEKRLKTRGGDIDLSGFNVHDLASVRGRTVRRAQGLHDLTNSSAGHARQLSGRSSKSGIGLPRICANLREFLGTHPALPVKFVYAPEVKQ